MAEFEKRVHVLCEVDFSLYSFRMSQCDTLVSFFHVGALVHHCGVVTPL